MQRELIQTKVYYKFSYKVFWKLSPFLIVISRILISKFQNKAGVCYNTFSLFHFVIVPLVSL